MLPNLFKKLVFILLSFPFVVFGQISIGIKLGGAISKTNVPNRYPATHSLVTPNIGITCTQTIDKFQFTIEPGYTTLGIGWKGAMTCFPGHGIYWPMVVVPNGYEKYVYHFFEVPATVGWMPIHKKLILCLHAGITPSYFLKGSFKFNCPEKSSMPIYAFKYINIGYLLGLKIALNISDHWCLNLVGRYNIGLTNLTTTEDSQPTYFTGFTQIDYRF